MFECHMVLFPPRKKNIFMNGWATEVERDKKMKSEMAAGVDFY